MPTNHDGWMWDLTVPGNNDHDFYVAAGDGEGHATAGFAPVLVHNGGGGCGPFVNGDIFLHSFSTGSGNLDVAAQVSHDGPKLHLDDLMIFPQGTQGLGRAAMGPEAISSLLSQVSDMARQQGFDKIIITCTRFLKGGALRRPGTMTIDLGGK